MTENMHWKLPLNLKTLENMGRHDLVNREQERQQLIKEADIEWFQKHGRFITYEEFKIWSANK